VCPRAGLDNVENILDPTGPRLRAISAPSAQCIASMLITTAESWELQETVPILQTAWPFSADDRLGLQGRDM
jgi:hypothetical protein